MKKIYCLVLLLIALAPQTLRAQLINWETGKKLEWSDFKGPVDGSSPYFANTHSNVKYAYHTTFSNGIYTLTFTVECNFDKKLSWSVTNKQTPALLTHEQLHFDISELFARRLMATFKSTQYTSNYQAEVNRIFAQNIKDKREMQDKYDAETNHSINKDKQQEWETYVKEQLAQTPAY